MNDDLTFVKHDIFISYRHDDSMAAFLTYYFLKQNGYDVWWDMDMNADPDFDEFPPVIEATVCTCKDMILIVTKNTFSDRINEERDWIRKEIKCALENGIRITPLLFDDTPVPKTLPEGIERLTDRYKFFSSPFDPHIFTVEQMHDFFSKRLNSSSSFKKEMNSVKVPKGYDSHAREEETRLKIQAQHTKEFDMTVIGEVIEQLGGSGLKVLDVGCADGSLGRDRFEADCFSRVVGIDKNAECITRAKETLSGDAEAARKFRYKNLDISDDDFEREMRSYMIDLDIAEGFDIIFAAQVMHFIPKTDMSARLQTLKGLLKPNGVIIIRDSDDGSKLAYATDEENRNRKSLDSVLAMTDALQNVADRHTGRKLSVLLHAADFKDVRVYSFMRDTSQMKSDQRKGLYDESFGWRLEVVEKEKGAESQAYKVMKNDLKKLKSLFLGSKSCFWYCEYDYIAVATAE